MKTKSKLVLGLSILSAATLAAGATSTFAWWQVTSTATAGSKTTFETVSVTKAEYQAGQITVPVTVTLQRVAEDQGKLVLARHSDSDTTAPALESAYLNSLGAVVPVSAAQVTAGKFGTDKILYSSLKLTIAIDFADGWKQTGGSDATEWSNAAYFVYDGVNYSKDDVLGQLNDATIKVGMKHTESSTERGRLFRTTSGAGDPFYFNGTATVNAVSDASDAFDGYTIIDATLDNDFSAATGKIEIADYVKYYVYGSHQTNVAEEGQDEELAETEDGASVGASFDVMIAGN